MKGEIGLQHIWRARAVPLTGLAGSGGERIDVLDTGTWNRADGPDFLDARIVIDGHECLGDVEMHLRSADWYAHGHHLDPAYARVVLHVGLDTPKSPLLRPDGTPIPCVALAQRLPDWLRLDAPTPGLACAPVIPLNAAVLEAQLAEAAARYFEETAQQVLALFDPALPPSEAWKRALVLRCCSVLGIPNNRDAMVRAGAKLWDSRHDGPADAVPGLPDHDGAGKPIVWARSGCRPASHPSRRLAQAAHILRQVDATPFELFWRTPPEQLARSLWGQAEPRPSKTLHTLLLGAVLLPALWVQACLTGHSRRSAETRGLWMALHLPASPEAARAFAEAGACLPPDLAKGATFLWRSLCREHRCLECRVGNVCRSSA